MFHLYEKINSLAGRNLPTLQKSDIYVGAYCLALFEDDFYRAEIKVCTTSGVQVWNYIIDIDLAIILSQFFYNRVAEIMIKTDRDHNKPSIERHMNTWLRKNEVVFIPTPSIVDTDRLIVLNDHFQWSHFHY